MASVPNERQHPVRAGRWSRSVKTPAPPRAMFLSVLAGCPQPRRPRSPPATGRRFQTGRIKPEHAARRRGEPSQRPPQRPVEYLPSGAGCGHHRPFWRPGGLPGSAVKPPTAAGVAAKPDGASSLQLPNSCVSVWTVRRSRQRSRAGDQTSVGRGVAARRCQAGGNVMPTHVRRQQLLAPAKGGGEERPNVVVPSLIQQIRELQEAVVQIRARVAAGCRRPARSRRRNVASV